MREDGEKTRSDVIQVEYELYSDMVRERRAKGDGAAVLDAEADVVTHDDMARAVERMLEAKLET